MKADLTERLVKFGLALHEEKTRLITFGKYAAERRSRIGMGRPETFDFLGFTHYCATSRDGRFVVKRKTQRKRKICKLHELRVEARRRMHQSIAKQHEWLSAVSPILAYRATCDPWPASPMKCGVSGNGRSPGAASAA